jgi:hypothetical protein
MKIGEPTTAYQGELDIDARNGVITFTTKNGQRLLRITHLPDPIPAGTTIDLVALEALTSYTKIEWYQEAPSTDGRPEDHWREAREPDDGSDAKVVKS